MEEVRRKEELDYYEEYCKIYVYNSVLCKKVQELQEEKQRLLAKIAYVEEAIMNGSKRKRSRRKAEMIDRHFKCPICDKGYGYSIFRSEGSLNQHIRNKHKDSQEQSSN